MPHDARQHGIIHRTPEPIGKERGDDGVTLAHRHGKASSSEQHRILAQARRRIKDANLLNAAHAHGLYEKLTTKAVDKNYAAADVPDAVTYSASSGEVDKDGVFTAGTRAGTVTVRAKADGVSGETTVRVIDEPTTLTLHKKGADKSLDGMVLAGGSKTELSVEALYYGMPVSAQNSC